MKNETDIEKRIHQLITEERNTGLNPYLSTRVMAAIERRENHHQFRVSRPWKPVLALASLFVAIILGVAAGNLYSSTEVDTGSVLNNDSQTEHFAFYLQSETEE